MDLLETCERGQDDKIADEFKKKNSEIQRKRRKHDRTIFHLQKLVADEPEEHSKSDIWNNAELRRKPDENQFRKFEIERKNAAYEECDKQQFARNFEQVLFLRNWFRLLFLEISKGVYPS